MSEQVGVSPEAIQRQEAAVMHVREMGVVAGRYGQREIHLPPQFLANKASALGLIGVEPKTLGYGTTLPTFDAKMMTTGELRDRIQNLVRIHSHTK